MSINQRKAEHLSLSILHSLVNSLPKTASVTATAPANHERALSLAMDASPDDLLATALHCGCRVTVAG